MRRLWAPLASLGVDHIILTNADKVERNYFATHWLNEQTYRPLLIEGVEQSGDTRLPKVSILRRFKPFIEDQLDKEFGQAHKLLLHPRNARPLYDTAFRKGAHVLVAIGPEGGWSDYEVDILVSHGFECVAHGWRILRSDVACIATISSVSLLMENN
jgi:RsmE family RNA methyltransferase